MIFGSFCSYRLHAVLCHAVLGRAGPLPGSTPFAFYIAMQPSQAVLYLQGRDINWESAASTSALVRCDHDYTCTMLPLWSCLCMSWPAHVCKAKVSMLAATLYTSLPLNCQPLGGVLSVLYIANTPEICLCCTTVGNLL